MTVWGVPVQLYRGEISNAVRKLIKTTPLKQITLVPCEEWKIVTFPAAMLWNASHLNNVLSLRPCQWNIFILLWVLEYLIYFGEEAMYLMEGKQAEFSCRNQHSNFLCFLVKLSTAMIFFESWVIRVIFKFRAPGTWWWCNSAFILKSRRKRKKEIPGLVIRD